MMRKRLGKGICIAIVLVTLIGSVAGCGQKKEGNDTSASTQVASTQVKGDPVDLSVEVFDRATPGQDPATDNYWTKWIQENCLKDNNINVKFIPIARAQEVDQLNILMASNSAPDLCFTYSAPTVYNYVKNDGITDFGTLIDKYGPDLKKFLGDSLVKYGQFDGKQYVIPARNTCPTPSTNTFIRKDWLDKAGVKEPTNVNELYTVLKAFKSQIPAVNGKDIVPFALSLTPSYDMVVSFRKDMSDEDFYCMSGVLTYFAMPGIKEGFRYFNKLYNEGLISKDFPLDKDGKLIDASISTGSAGVFEYNQYNLFGEGKPYQALLKNVPGASLVPFKPFIDNKGLASKQSSLPVGFSIMTPKSSKRAAEAIKYMNWMSKPEVLSFLQNGKEGVHYTLVDGLPQTKSDIPNNMKSYANNNLDYTPIVNGLVYENVEKIVKVRSLTSTIKGAENLFVQSIMLAAKDSYLPSYFPVVIESETKYQATLTSKANEIIVKCVVATPSDFDNVYASLVKELLSNGGQKIIDERKAAYKNMKK